MAELSPSRPHFPEIPGVSHVSSMGLLLVKNISNLEQASASLAKAIEFETLPEPGRVAEGSGWHMAGLAPGEWLLLGPHATIAQLARALSTVEPACVLYADLSHARTVLSIALNFLSDILSAHSPINAAEALQPGRCTQTRVGDIRVFLARPGSTQEAVMMFDPSVTSYVAALFERPG